MGMILIRIGFKTFWLFKRKGKPLLAKVAERVPSGAAKGTSRKETTASKY